MMDPRVFGDETFEVKDIVKSFPKVARLNCRSENIEMELHLDINCDVYKVEQGDRFVLALSPSLSKEGVPNEDWYDQSDKPSLADDYEYVMYGKVFKFEDKGTKISVAASFGGLLMLLVGESRHFPPLELDSRIYLLMRKV